MILHWEWIPFIVLFLMSIFFIICIYVDENSYFTEFTSKVWIITFIITIIIYIGVLINFLHKNITVI